MPSRTPYLQRRGDAFFFRIAVPADLRLWLKCYEITKSLRTRSRDIATVRALQVAAQAKRFFMEVREMAKSGNRAGEGVRVKYEFMVDMDELGQPRGRFKAEPHETEAVSVLVGQVLAAQAQFAGVASATSSAATNAMPPGRSLSTTSTQLTLGQVVVKFLENYPKDKAPMLKKLELCLPLLVEVVGDVPVSELQHPMLVDFFAVVCELPPKWPDIKRRTKQSAREIAALPHQKCISKKTFEGSYRACISVFLDWAHEFHGHENFPSISVKKISYQGERHESEHKQRPMTQDELRRLFTGPEMEKLAADPKNSAKCWLPLLGLFTGARVNEICQLNPQVDIWQDGKSGIWACRITAKTESAEHISKRVKNKVSERTVPLHPKLIELGFDDYVRMLRAADAKCLFPKFQAWQGRASAQAQKWFSNWLKAARIRDDSAGARVAGMHAFRSTFSNLALEADVDENELAGHVREGESAVARGYRGERSLSAKLDKLERIFAQLDIAFIKPVAAVIDG